MRRAVPSGISLTGSEARDSQGHDCPGRPALGHTGRDAHAAMIAFEAASEPINAALSLMREHATSVQS